MGNPRYSWEPEPFLRDKNDTPDGLEAVTRGVHAKNPVLTPKWFTGAEGTGYREDLARMYLPISKDDLPRFLNSVRDEDSSLFKSADPSQLAYTLAKSLTGKGYLDFFLTQVARGFQEKVDVIETLSDSFVAYYFGAAAEMWTFSGVLLNTVEDEQAVNMYRIYKHFIRGTQLAKRRTLVHIRYDSYIVAGSVQSMNDVLNGDNEMAMPFVMNLLVHRVYIRPRAGVDGQPAFGITKPSADSPFAGKGLTLDPMLPTSAFSVQANYELIGNTGSSVPSGGTPPSTSVSEPAAEKIQKAKEEVKVLVEGDEAAIKLDADQQAAKEKYIREAEGT